MGKLMESSLRCVGKHSKVEAFRGWSTSCPTHIPGMGKQGVNGNSRGGEQGYQNGFQSGEGDPQAVMVVYKHSEEQQRGHLHGFRGDRSTRVLQVHVKRD